MCHPARSVLLATARRCDWEELGGRGKLVAFTTIHIAPTAMIEAGYSRDNPYCTGIVRLAEGPAISAQILGVDPTKPEADRNRHAAARRLCPSGAKGRRSGPTWPSSHREVR